MNLMNNLRAIAGKFKIPSPQTATPWGLFFLRVAASCMILTHGIPKFLSYSEKLHTFSDPLGVSSPVSLTMAIGAEVFCAIALLLGLRPRFAAVPLLFTMLVAGILVHSSDPFQKKEMAFMYGIIFATLMICGGGALQLDTWLARKTALLRKR
jgi:putative oxidoreductase